MKIKKITIDKSCSKRNRKGLYRYNITFENGSTQGTCYQFETVGEAIIRAFNTLEKRGLVD